MGGIWPGRMGRATCYSARATALRPSVVAANVVSGFRVCRQQSHLSGRAAAWVGRNDSLRAVCVAALCMCSHPAIISSSGCGRQLQLSSVKTSSSRASGAPGTQARRHDVQLIGAFSPACNLRFNPHTIRQSALQSSQFASPPLPPAERLHTLLHVSLARQHRKERALVECASTRTFHFKPCVTTPTRACTITKLS